ncbi:MAG: thiamine pyrophosphate-binding protein, partial [Oscillospiraceae bacterium]|nr:thiamine pyrophosphate-binding protein [Oscillospiraceae bacterium]
MNAAKALVKCLEKEGVTTIFGYPGAAICPFYHELSASKLIQHVLVRHEANAGHAASGYARISGKPGKEVGLCPTTRSEPQANEVGKEVGLCPTTRSEP